MATDTAADTRPAIGTVGRVKHPAKGDWGKDYRVTDHTTLQKSDREIPTLQVDSLDRLVEHKLGSVDGTIPPTVITHEDKPAERCKYLMPHWFVPDKEAHPKEEKPHAQPTSGK